MEPVGLEDAENKHTESFRPAIWSVLFDILSAVTKKMISPSASTAKFL